MKAAKVLLPVLMLLLVGLFPPVALAADEDFEVEYEFSPDVVGSAGGDVQLLLTVRNAGSSNITWVDVVINTTTPFSSRWTGTIAPGASRTVSFNVTFGEDDVNTRKLLQVSMNNNSTANPDGVKTIPFELHGTSHMYTIAGGVSPARSSYEVGDTVTISYSITNVMEGNTLMHMTTRASIDHGPLSFAFWVGAEDDLGNVFPGATKTRSVSYTFAERDSGDVNLGCVQKFTFLGVSYQMHELIAHFTVVAPPPEVSFTATLSADPMEVDRGDTVELRVALRNTGADAIGGFAVTAEGGGLESFTESLPAGASGSIALSTPVFETTTFRFLVVGTTGDVSDSVRTNAVTVTVREPEAPASSATTAAGPAAPTSTFLAPTPAEGAPGTEAGDSSSTTEVASLSTTDVASSSTTAPADAAAQETGGLSNTMIIVIVAAAAAVAIAVVITVGAITAKRRGGGATGTGA